MGEGHVFIILEGVWREKENIHFHIAKLETGASDEIYWQEVQGKIKKNSLLPDSSKAEVEIIYHIKIKHNPLAP